MRHRILIVDDEKKGAEELKTFLKDFDLECSAEHSGAGAIRAVRESAQPFSLIILDFNLGDARGDEVARKILMQQPNQKIIVYSAVASDDAWKLSWKVGAISFVRKPNANELIKEVLFHCRSIERSKNVSTDANTSERQRKIESFGLRGASESLYRLVQLIERLQKVKSRDPILIVGERGTGKELVAKAIHGGRGPFTQVDCGRFRKQESHVESDLFGHERGSFTGADRLKRGLIEEARGGVTFLDEVHHLPEDAQAKLLRFLQEGTIRRLGGLEEIKIDTRIVSACQPVIWRHLERETFARDLFDRMALIVLEIPPLRERKEDIPILAQYFCSQWNTEHEKNYCLGESALDSLSGMLWDGNVRALRRVVRASLTLATRESLEAEDLVESDLFASRTSALDRRLRKNESHEELKERHRKEESEMILRNLNEFGSQVVAARNMGLKRSTTLKSMMDRLQIKEVFRGIYETVETRNPE